MKKSEKKVEALLAKDESVIWTGQTPVKYTVLTVLNPVNLLLDCMIGFFIWILTIAHSLPGAAFCILVAAIKLIFSIRQISTDLGTRYYVTSKGIYAQNSNGTNTTTVFMSYAELNTIDCERLNDLILYKLGTLTCRERNLGRFIRITNIQMP